MGKFTDHASETVDFRSYEVPLAGVAVWAVGVVELLGGVLLTCRRTRLLGALVVLGVMANVVMLNFCYDVSVKLHSSHLLAMTLFVAAAGLRRLVDRALAIETGSEWLTTDGDYRRFRELRVRHPLDAQGR